MSGAGGLRANRNSQRSTSGVSALSKAEIRGELARVSHLKISHFPLSVLRMKSIEKKRKEEKGKE